jgi:hypothetical protein
VLLETLDTGAVWSVARGLARKVAEYKRHLAACDSPRRNDLDERGALSEEALAAFTKFFLEVCVDQVEFMEGLMQPDALRARILLWAEEQIKLSKLPPSSGRVLEALLYRGNLPRSGVASVAGASTRTATRIVSALTEAGVLTSDTPYAPVRLVFPAALAERWMPGLFPEKREWRLFLGPRMIHYHRYNHDVTTNQVTVHIVFIVAIVVVVAMGVTVNSPFSIGNRNN